MEAGIGKTTSFYVLTGLLLMGGLDLSASSSKGSADTSSPVSVGARAGVHATLPGDSTYEVTRYKLDLSIPLVSSALSGSVTITCRSLTDNLDQIILDMDTAIVISGASIDAFPLVPTYDATQLKLTLPIPQPVALHDTFTIVVHYAVGAVNNGFYSYQMSAYTDWAAAWFPCHDVPWDKATFDLHVTVPRGVEVASVGRLIGRAPSGDGLSETFNWSTDYPVATHLVGLMMSGYYSRWSDWYLSSLRDSIEISYFVFQRDSALAIQDFVHIVPAMEFFVTMIGPYPFEKYGMAEVEPLYYGGMEYQTMSMISSSWIRGDATAEDGFVHELAHQWWGDAVGFNDWYSLWLSEGFAEYSAALFAEFQYGVEAFRASMEKKRSRYLQQAALLDYSIAHPTFDYSHIPIVYKKGAWVLHMLRSVAGDEEFWRIFQDYFDQYKYSTVTIPQFQSIAEAVYGGDLGWFFSEWIYNLGYPIFDATAVTREITPGNFECAITLNQIQSSGPVFTMPLEIRLTAPNEQLDTTVWIDSPSHTVVLSLPFSPQGLEIDPFGRVLLETGIISLHDEGKTGAVAVFSLYQNYPNPFNASTTIEYQLPQRGHVSLGVFNVLGQEVAVLVDEVGDQGYQSVEFNATELPSGVYFYRLSAGGFVATKKLLLMK